MLARVATFALDGVDSRPVWVEVDIRRGLPAFSVVGLADTAVREARERVHAAIVNSELAFPGQRITANLAPASMRKVGPGFDLPLAVAVLAASGQVPPEALRGVAVYGELSLDGIVRGCRGTLAVAEGAARAGLKTLLVAPDRAGEAALVEHLEVVPVADLCGALRALGGERSLTVSPAPPQPVIDAPDLADVRGHASPRFALEIAAAGGHNLLFQGPPGTGKTMLARRLPSILPPLTAAQAREVTRIHSVVGAHDGTTLITERPFRSPHHSTSASGLVGGGSGGRPLAGEVTLAHHGVLFLDELSEFARGTLDALRQPLEDGHVVVVRGQRAAIFPSACMLVAATNPCPCGYAGADARECSCGEIDHARHRRRISGPLLDRIDMCVDVHAPSAEELAGGPGQSSADVRERVIAARERQERRLLGSAAGCNAQLDGRLLRSRARITAEAEAALGAEYDQRRLSPRSHDRILRVARTIADLEAASDVRPGHVMVALGFRGTRDGEQAAA